MKTRVDLHIHSDNSDGSDSISQLIENIKKTDIKTFALTDHDTIEGCLDIASKIPNGIKFIYGVELTCTVNDIKCHILGYNYNPEDKGLLELIQKGKILRKQKLETRIKYLKDTYNINLTKEELEWLYSRHSVVKTHIANILVNRKLADNNISAMEKFLDNCKTGNTRFDGLQAIQTIKNANGISVWAHPLGGEGERHFTESEFLPKLKKMIEAGIQGLECYYSRYSIDEINFLVNCAKKYNLYVTGGSDYHGTNKTIPLGRLNSEDKFIDSSLLTILDNLK